MTELAKTFDPAAIEAKWYQHWETSGAFRPARPDATPFTIVNPPPNVTGSLHIGHALDNTLQDIVIRHERLKGKDALWVVGTDHAGIATQMVVERQMALTQDKRTNYSREDFIAKVWEWKAESGGTITGQLRRLGCSMDWSREQFTMDPHFTRAVVKVFVDLYNEGLLYRDKRLVNWDPALKTAISDLEVENRQVQGHMWHFKYPLAGGETYVYRERDADGAIVLEEVRDYIAIATTRPETMLGDGAVAVHPDDARYAPIVGKLCEIPVGPKAHRRLIPIITDDYPDPDFGSGAVKITGAHDENDYGVAQRNNIPMYRLMDEVAAMRTDGAPYAQAAERAQAIAKGAPATKAEIDALNLVPDAYRGLDRYEARERVIADIDAEGLMIKVEDKLIMQPFGDRGGVVIEPMLTDQWYVDAATLAKPAMDAVRSGAIEIVPKSWEKTFFNWMENIQPWCVSRQLWWGHRIPAWFGPAIVHDDLSRSDGTFAAIQELPDLENIVDRTWSRAPEIFVAQTYEDAAALARLHYAKVGIDFDLAVGFSLAEIDGAQEARSSFGNGVLGLWRDPDVLDTWFSSALWPFATLGWPDGADQSPSRVREGLGVGLDDAGKPNATAQAHPPAPSRVREGEQSLLARHYPNDLLISGFDILFFWDARMAMQGIHFMKEVPWKRLYLHGLVRAADGQKMSKSKGNVVDPLGLIDRYGADALRFFMAAMESQGRDVKMDEKRVEGYRNFATKLWNAVRFAQANGIGASTSLAAPVATLAVNKWIIGEVVATLGELDKALADLRFDAAANAIYHFVWDRFCDWYLELVKPVLSNPPRTGQVAPDAPASGDGGGEPDGAAPGASPLHHPAGGPPPRAGEDLERAETRAVAGWVIDQILVMLHPFMPFITEELWHAQGPRDDLILARWPAPAASIDADAKAEIDWLIRLVSEVRAARSELGVPPGARLSAIVNEAAPQTRARIERLQPIIARLARIESLSHDGAAQGGAAQIVVDEATFILPLEGVIDIAAERARLTKSLEAAQKEAGSLEGRLANPAFVEKAKPEAVEKARTDQAEKSAEAARLAAALARLG